MSHLECVQEAMAKVKAVLLAIDEPAKVLVLAPRQCGLEDLAEEIALARADVCVELRYYKPLRPEDRRCRTGIKRNRLRGRITIRFQTPHEDDKVEKYDFCEEFRFSEILAPYSVRIAYTKDK